MRIVIRETKTTDFVGVDNVLKICGLSGDWFTKKLFRNLVKKNNGLYFVALESGKIVGNIFAFEDGGYCGYIYKLGILPKYRLAGIAQKLIKRALASLKKRGIDWAFAHVEKENKASLGLLKKLGFNVRGTHHLVDNRYF